MDILVTLRCPRDWTQLGVRYVCSTNYFDHIMAETIAHYNIATIATT